MSNLVTQSIKKGRGGGGGGVGGGEYFAELLK